VALSVKFALSESPRPLAGMPSYGDRTFLSRWRERLPIRQAQFQYKLSALSFQLSAPEQDRELAGGRLRLWLHRRHALETNGLSDTPACAGRDLDTDGFSRLAKFARFVFPSFPIPSPSGLVVLSRDARQELCPPISNLPMSSCLKMASRREFTIFDAPGAQDRLPLELVLVFDTNPKIEALWDRRTFFASSPNGTTRYRARSCKKDNADVRISVYHCSGQTLYRSTPATTDAQKLTASFRSLLAPPPSSSRAR